MEHGSLKSLRIRKIHNERRALAFSAAFSADGSPMPLNDVSDNCKAGPKASLHACDEISGLPELIENMWQECRANDHSRVADPDMGPIGRTVQMHLDQSALLCEFYGVRQQVPYHLLYAITVAPDQTI